MENESLNNRPIAELVSFPNSDFVKINHGAGWSPTKLGGCSGVIVYFPPGKVMYLHSPKTMVSEIEHFPWASHLQFRWCLMSLSPRYFTTGRDHYWVEERKTSFQSGWQWIWWFILNWAFRLPQGKIQGCRPQKVVLFTKNRCTVPLRIIDVQQRKCGCRCQGFYHRK